MNDKKNNPNVSDVFDSLVRNAIDFFKHSLVEFESDPKYSVIHFYTSVELFFKARLLLEHWALILSDPSKAKYKNFLQGEFASVGLEDSVQRLSGISGENFDDQEKKVFSNLKNHRNRLMHFYHAEYQNENSNLLAEIAAEQIRGWFYLHKLLTVNWRSKFESYFEQISELQALMKKHKEFLNIRHEHIQKKIAQEQSEGIAYIVCYSCEFLAGRISSHQFGPVNAVCQVCEDEFLGVRTICPKCRTEIVLAESSPCPNCGNGMHFVDVAASLPESVVSERAFCGKCKIDVMPTMAMIEDEWFCYCCFTKVDAQEVNKCQWCGELVTGETGDYYNPGCFMCAAHLQREADYLEDEE